MQDPIKKPFHSHHYHEVASNLHLGFWTYLMTDFILFATLFATYAVLRTSGYGEFRESDLFFLPRVLFETIVLLTSTFFCGMAQLALSKDQPVRMFGWYAGTFLLGFIFLSMVGIDFFQLIQRGATPQTSALLSIYFTLIGVHAVHILFGLLFLLFFLTLVWRWGLIPINQRRLNCLNMFWFFSYIVWVLLFVLVYLIGARS